LVGNKCPQDLNWISGLWAYVIPQLKEAEIQNAKWVVLFYGPTKPWQPRVITVFPDGYVTILVCMRIVMPSCIARFMPS